MRGRAARRVHCLPISQKCGHELNRACKCFNPQSEVTSICCGHAQLGTCTGHAAVPKRVPGTGSPQWRAAVCGAPRQSLPWGMGLLSWSQTSPPAGSLQGFPGNPRVLGTATCHKPIWLPSWHEVSKAGELSLPQPQTFTHPPGLPGSYPALDSLLRSALAGHTADPVLCLGSTETQDPLLACRIPQQMTKQGA